MNRERLLLGVVAAGFLAVAASLGASCGDGDDSGAEPGSPGADAVVDRFFHWYAAERRLGRDPVASGDLEKNPDVTPGFVQSIKSAAARGVGVDPILCGPSLPHEFEVGKPRGDETSATVTVVSGHGSEWRVGLTRQGGAWRIHSITCLGK